MGDRTGIQWTDATWNPVTGCTKVSAGCLNCYAEAVARRFAGEAYPTPFVPWTVHAQRQAGVSPVTLHPDRLDAPLHWKKPRRVFVNSMSDLFHEAVPFEFVEKVWWVMSRAEQHTFQILTKRPERMLEWFRTLAPRDRVYDLAGNKGAWPLPNVHLGVSVEDQKNADERLPLLAQVPAAVRFVSYEPALGPVDFRPWLRWRHACDQPEDHLLLPDCDIVAPDIDWLIVGGESGPGARPFDIQWARDIVQQCKAEGVAAFYKQGGASNACAHDRKGGHFACFPDDLKVREFPHAL